jgi:hypothetical protein
MALAIPSVCQLFTRNNLSKHRLVGSHVALVTNETTRLYAWRPTAQHIIPMKPDKTAGVVCSLAAVVMRHQYGVQHEQLKMKSEILRNSV